MKSLFSVLIWAGVVAFLICYFIRLSDRLEDTPPAIAMTLSPDGIPHRSEFAVLSDDELRLRMTPRQFDITRKDGTEPAFANAYWSNKAEGIYVDIISGEPLFSSREKFRSGTGWPSFWTPLNQDEIVEVLDNSWGMRSVEVRSKSGDTHLGHVFNDGPAPTGLRYCINSASLVFVPKEKLGEKGYAENLEHFEGGGQDR